MQVCLDSHFFVIFSSLYVYMNSMNRMGMYGSVYNRPSLSDKAFRARSIVRTQLTNYLVNPQQFNHWVATICIQHDNRLFYIPEIYGAFAGTKTYCIVQQCFHNLSTLYTRCSKRAYFISCFNVTLESLSLLKLFTKKTDSLLSMDNHHAWFVTSKQSYMLPFSVPDQSLKYKHEWLGSFIYSHRS